MTTFKNLSIKNRLIAIILLVTSVVIIGGFAVDIYRTNAVLKDELRQSATLQTTLIGEYCVVPLSFDDRQVAENILARLRALPAVESGYIYDESGDIFASFERTGGTAAPSLSSLTEHAVFADGYLHTYQPIIFNAKDYGTVYLRTSTATLDQKIRENVYITIVIIALLLVVSYILAMKLQGLISKPILELAAVTEKISAEGDYSLRVQRRSDDEIGLLYGEFNNMLDQIHARDDSLKLIHARLNEAQRIASIGNWDWNTVSNELWWSDEIYRMFQIDPKTFGATYEAFMERVHPEDRSVLDGAVQRALNGQDAYSIDHRIILPDGTQRVVHEQGEVYSNDEGQAIRMVGTVHDISERKQAEESIRRRAEYQALLAKLSSELVQAQPGDIHQQLSHGLEAVGTSYGLDTINMWWFAEDRESMRPFHRWSRNDSDSTLKHLSRTEIPWLADQLLAGEPVVCHDVDQLPLEASNEKITFKKTGVKSILIIPLLVDENLEGSCAFSMLREKRTWSDETLVELKLIAENLAAAFARSLAVAEIEKLRAQLEEENIYLREEVRVAHGFDEIIGETAQLRRSLQAVEKVAPTDATVLIQGETGTGKELIARAIHNLSSRRDKPMVSVNCPALPVNLIESELFGHEKGAFTGAQAMRKGRFELANGGTLFLDELGELPLEVQAKLLRVLQSGEFQRLGSNDTLHSDVRLIAATNRDLKQAVEKNEFRADFYYRINYFPIGLPALRDRKDDIPLLAEHFVRKHAERLGKKIDAISSRMIRKLMQYSWPGNIRELESVIERALITSSDNSVLELAEPLKATVGIPATEPVLSIGESTDLSAVERSHILNVLEQTEWLIAGKNGAAVALGIPSSTLRSKMNRLGITRPKS